MYVEIELDLDAINRKTQKQKKKIRLHVSVAKTMDRQFTWKAQGVRSQRAERRKMKENRQN